MRLNREFLERPATELATQLLGTLVCRRTENGIIRLPITETECYFGEEDTACHASRGRTARTDILYHSGGLAYVYLCYGIHSLLNVVTGPEGHPEAVLIRGVGDIFGPGRVTKALGITREQNGEDLISSETLWLEDSGLPIPEYVASKRIGIDYAEEKDREALWNYRVRK